MLHACEHKSEHKCEHKCVHKCEHKCGQKSEHKCEHKCEHKSEHAVISVCRGVSMSGCLPPQRAKGRWPRAALPKGSLWCP